MQCLFFKQEEKEVCYGPYRWCPDVHLIIVAPLCKNRPFCFIDGYRSAIADKLGNSSINVSKNEDLTRLLDSFHRDRPKGRRGIPSWNLSLVLHQLTKAPFEPIQESSLKHLTFKTVFLLALGSGKRRSEMHAWLNKNIRRQSDWSQVSLYPSPSFLSKNQLAKEGPNRGPSGHTSLGSKLRQVSQRGQDPVPS